jgi:putative transposase
VIDRWFPSSKLCNVCGYKYQNLSLNERDWICPVCNTNHNRDFNAATNIMKEGQRIIGQRLPKFTLADNPTMDDKLSNKTLKSSDWLKQEEKTY